MAKGNKRFLNATVATALVATSFAGTAISVEASKSFSDVKAADYFSNDVVNLTERGIIKGFEDGSFRPNDFVTRGQAAKIIAGALGLNTTNVNNPNFKDIQTTHSYYGAIAALANAGIINGFEDKTFRAGEPIQRNHMAKIIAGAFNLQASSTETPFTDVRSDYQEYISALYDFGITTGKTATTFDGSSNVKRGQLAAFVVRAENVNKAATSTFTITNITSTVIQTSQGDLTVDRSLSVLFSEENTAALVGAEVTANVVDGLIKGISAMTLTAAGTTDAPIVLDAKNARVSSNVTVKSDYVVVKNMTITGNFIIDEQVKNQIATENVTVEGQLEVKNSTNSLASLTPIANVNAALKLNLKATTLSNVVVERDNVSIISDKKLGTITTSKNVAKINVQADFTTLSVNGTEKVVVTGKGAVDRVQVAANTQLDYQVVGAIKELVIADPTAKIKLGTTVTIEKLIIPEGVTVTSVIENYNSIKSKIVNIVDATGKVVPKPATGGGGGGSKEPTTSTEPEPEPEPEPKPEPKPEPEPEQPQEPEFIETEVVTAGTIAKAGKYGPNSGGKLVVEGNLVIESPGVTLQNVIVTGNLTLGAGIGEGDVNLNGVEVTGTTRVNGGGENSIYFTDTVLATVIVNKNTGAVRIVAQGNTQVVEVQLESSAIVEEENLTGTSEGFENVTLTEAAGRNANVSVSLVGEFESINSRATNVQIELSEQTTIRELILQVAAHVTGLGRINTAYINNNGSTLAQRPQNVVLDIGTSVVINGEEETESFDDGTTIVELEAIKATQNSIDLQFSSFISEVTSRDLAIVATIDGEEVALNNLRYNPSSSRFTFDPISLVDNIGKEVVITASPDSGRVSGNAITSSYEISYGFAGRITDIHSAGAANATVTFRKTTDDTSWGTSGDTGNITTADTVIVATTDRFGYYSVSVPTPGQYLAEISGAGYLATTFLATASSDYYLLNQNETAMRAAGADEVKVVLTWGEEPRDLDSHLTGPTINGGQFHVYFGDKKEEIGNTTFVDLDWDDTSSYGPETTTIRKLLDGTYRFYVHNWSGTPDLNVSDAKVEVYKGNSNRPDYVFELPETISTARNWIVFDLEVSENGETIEIVPLNIFTDFQNSVDFTVNGIDANNYVTTGDTIELYAGEGVEIRYAINAEATLDSPLYDGPISLTESANISVIVLVNGAVMIEDSRYFEVFTTADYDNLLDVEQQLLVLIGEEKYLDADELYFANDEKINHLNSIEEQSELRTRLYDIQGLILDGISSLDRIVYRFGDVTITSMTTSFDSAQINFIESISLDEHNIEVGSLAEAWGNTFEFYLSNYEATLPAHKSTVSTVTVRYKDNDDESKELVFSDLVFLNRVNY